MRSLHDLRRSGTVALMDTLDLAQSVSKLTGFRVLHAWCLTTQILTKLHITVIDANTEREVIDYIMLTNDILASQTVGY